MIWLRSGERAVVDDGGHLAVVEGAQRRVVLERDLRNLVLGVDRHLEYVGSWKYPTLSIHYLYINTMLG